MAECDRCNGRGWVYQACPSCGEQLTEEQVREIVTIGRGKPADQITRAIVTAIVDAIPPISAEDEKIVGDLMRERSGGDRLASPPRALSRRPSQGSRDEPTGQGTPARRQAIPIAQRLMIGLCALWVLFYTAVDMARDVQRKALRTELATCTGALADAGAEADAAHARGLAEGRLDGLNEAADIRRAAETADKALDSSDSYPSYPMDEVHPQARPDDVDGACARGFTEGRLFQRALDMDEVHP